MSIIYRLTLYDNEDQPLTPIDTSIHTDAFSVATQELPGFRGYIGNISPGAGRSQIPDSAREIGRYQVTLHDFRTGTSNLERWVTAFIGDGEGRLRVMGAKALVEESIDDGSSWSPVFVGRVHQFGLTGPQTYEMQITDDAERMKRKIFELYPTEDGPRSRVIRQTLLPIGWEESFEGLPEPDLVRVRYSVRRDPIGQIITGHFMSPLEQELERPDVKLTDNLRQYGRLPYFRPSIGRTLPNACIMEVYSTSGNLVTELVVKDVNVNRDEDVEDIFNLQVLPVDTIFSNVYNIPGLTENTEYLVRVLPPPVMGTDDNLPFILQADHPLDLLKDILDGEYDDITGSQGSYIPITYDEAQIDAVKAQNPAPEFWALIDSSMSMLDFVEDSLLAPYSLAYTMTPKVDNGPSSEFTLFSIRVPDSLPSTTLVDDDILAEEFIDWSPQTPISVVLKNRVMVTRTVDLMDEDTEDPYYVVENEHREIDSNALVNDNFREFRIAGLGLMRVEVEDEDEDVVPTDNVIVGLATPYMSRFGKPNAHLEVHVRRGAYEGLEPGDWVITELQWQPDTATFRRGSPRLMQLVGKTPYGQSLHLQFVDSGVYDVLSPPTINSASLEGQVGLSVSLTASTDGAVLLEYAFTEASSLPQMSSSKWQFFDVVDMDENEQRTFTLNGPPAGKYAFVRARTERSLSGPIAVPSVWVTAQAGQVGALPAPTGLTVSNATFYSADVSWSTPGGYQIEVWTTANESGELKRFSVETPGTAEMVLTNLDRAPTAGNTVAIRHKDYFGNRSNFTTTTFNRGAGTNPAPAMGGIFIFDIDLFGDNS